MEMKKRFRVPAFLRNKYIVCGVFFFVWLLFLDRHNILSQYQLYTEVNQLESQKAFYRQEIDRARQDQYELLSSPEKLEKFAREQYRMKKEEEDLFIVPESRPKAN